MQHYYDLFRQSYFNGSYRRYMPCTLAWWRAGLVHACQSGNMVILLTSLFFVSTILFLPKYCVNYCDYIIKWCFGIKCNWCVSLDISQILALKCTSNGTTCKLNLYDPVKNFAFAKRRIQRDPRVYTWKVITTLACSIVITLIIRDMSPLFYAQSSHRKSFPRACSISANSTIICYSSLRF